MEAQPVGEVLITARTDAAGEAPVGSGPRSPLPVLFLALCIGSGMLLHAEQLAAAAAAAAAEHLCPIVVVCVVISVTALFNLSIFSLNFLVARGRAAGAGGPRLLLRPTARSGAAPAVSASKSLLAPFFGLCLAMGAALHAKSLAAAATEYQIDPAVVVCVALAGVALFHLAVLSIQKTLASHRAEGEPKQLPRSRRLPLLPFVVLPLAISAASSVETVMADLPQDASVWAALALAVSFDIAIGSLYCFIIDGPPPPTAATVEPWSRTKSAGAIVSCITAAGIVSFMLLACGGASGAIAARS
ncbi:hypothetical protein SORBI_3002G216900 [Sorghum bicolor]|uniref:Uncharacterized protein n=1 Tax=Sorghum bicolor TaxID=4558 RepID=A0A1B6QCR6_SORBI|nr:hypothetical protein SORBI_3002G216900 [Sorghum bicolor]